MLSDSTPGSPGVSHHCFVAVQVPVAEALGRLQVPEPAAPASEPLKLASLLVLPTLRPPLAAAEPLTMKLPPTPVEVQVPITWPAALTVIAAQLPVSVSYTHLTLPTKRIV